MIPRAEIKAVEYISSLNELKAHLIQYGHTRVPVYNDTMDNVKGFIHIKDLLPLLSGREPFNMALILREVLFVAPSMKLTDLLVKMRDSGIHIAMVVDEYGGTDGLVTLEDIMEQVVGEIHDEFDVVERPLTLGDGAVIFDAALNVRDLDAQYNISLPEDPAYATVGGFVLAQLGFIPRGGESFEYGQFRFTVVEMDGRRVARVKIQRVRPAPEEERSLESSVSAVKTENSRKAAGADS